MNVVTRIVVVGLVVMVAALAGPPSARAADEPAPAFTAAGLDGAPVSLGSFKGKNHVVLVFYRSHG